MWSPPRHGPRRAQVSPKRRVCCLTGTCQANRRPCYSSRADESIPRSPCWISIACCGSPSSRALRTSHVKVGARRACASTAVLREAPFDTVEPADTERSRARDHARGARRSSSAARTRPTSCTASPGSAASGSSAFRQRGWVGLVFRRVLPGIPGFEALSMPPAVAALADQQHGLVLVSGLAGSGKTATLAAMVDHVNSTRECHIVTIEDPVEVLHADKRSVVDQREVGTDTPSAESALDARAAPGPRRDHGERDRRRDARRGRRCRRPRPATWCCRASRPSARSTPSTGSSSCSNRTDSARRARRWRRAARRRLATPARRAPAAAAGCLRSRCWS